MFIYFLNKPTNAHWYNLFIAHYCNVKLIHHLYDKTYHHPEPDQSNRPLAPSIFLKIHFNITFLHVFCPCGLCPSCFPTKTLYAPLSLIRATCPAHPILDLMTAVIFVEESRRRTASVCRLGGDVEIIVK